MLVQTEKQTGEHIMKPPITINQVDSIHDFSRKMLKGCYFYPTGNDTYGLYSKFDEELASDLRSGEDFEFTLGPFTWGVNEFFIDTELATGRWVSDLPTIRILKPPPDHDAEDEGSFAAAAGGHVPKEHGAAASNY